MKSILLVALLGILLFLGCVSNPEPKVVEVVKFQCANGAFSETQEGCAAKTCPIQICPDTQPQVQVITVTQYQCLDGDVVDSLTKCPTVQSPVEESLEGCYLLLNHSKHTNAYGWIVIAGEVKNNCSYAVQKPIYFTIYDEQGKVLSSDQVYPKPSTVQPGDTASYEETWYEETVVSGFGSYKVYLEK